MRRPFVYLWFCVSMRTQSKNRCCQTFVRAGCQFFCSWRPIRGLKRAQEATWRPIFQKQNPRIWNIPALPKQINKWVGPGKQSYFVWGGHFLHINLKFYSTLFNFERYFQEQIFKKFSIVGHPKQKNFVFRALQMSFNVYLTHSILKDRANTINVNCFVVAYHSRESYFCVPTF